MTYTTALRYKSRDIWFVADELAESVMYFDPKIQKIKEQIKEHEDAIRKLQLKIGEKRTALCRELLPEAEKKMEEAKAIIELHNKLELEFAIKLRKGAV